MDNQQRVMLCAVATALVLTCASARSAEAAVNAQVGRDSVKPGPGEFAQVGQDSVEPGPGEFPAAPGSTGVSPHRLPRHTGSDAQAGWLSQPLSLDDAIRVALAQNGDILKAQHDLEAAHGVSLQTRAVVLPKIRGSAGYEHSQAVESDPDRRRQSYEPLRNNWTGGIRLQQNIYEGGRLAASWRAAKLVKEQAYQDYLTVLADTILEVRTAYYDVLLTEQQIAVQQASVKLLSEELGNIRKRSDAGAVPRFDVLRGEVQVANARPRVIRAQNSFRSAKNRLATALGHNVPATVLEDIPMVLTTKLDPTPYEVALPQALELARARRPELHALRTEIDLQHERVKIARSGYLPALGVYAGYKAYNSEFSGNFAKDVSGPIAGVEMNWDIFDGLATRGRVVEARARESRSTVNLADQTRRVEQQVRTFYSSFIEAREVLKSQEKNVERAEEATRLASARYDAGSGTQLDVLDAQTSLTEARTTQIDAARDYLVARARVERAIGLDVERAQSSAPTTVETWKPKP